MPFQLNMTRPPVAERPAVGTVSMPPHGADRHTLDVAEPGADARVEDAAQAEVGPEAERELNVIRGVPGEQEHRWLDVGDDAHRRARRIEAPAERRPGGDPHPRRPAHQVAADAQQQGAVEREVDRVRDHALPRLGADQELGVARSGRIEEARLEPEVEPAAGHPIGALDGGPAAVGETQERADLGAGERAIGRVERGRPGRLRGDRRRDGDEPRSHDATKQRAAEPHALLLVSGCSVGQVPEGRSDVPHRRQQRGPAANSGRATVSDPATRLTPPRVEPQKRTPPVRMNVLPPPISPRASTNGVSLLPFNLNVVPPSRFSPALVSEALTVVVPTVAEALAWATFKPPPA